MATAPSISTSLVLNSWKEIAAYLGRGVRTVQRYERDLALPVRRPRGRSRSAVVALSDELDSWLRAAPTAELRPGPKMKPELLVTAVHNSIGAGAALRGQAQALRVAHREVLASLLTSIKELQSTTVVHVNSPSRKNSGSAGAGGNGNGLPYS